MKFGPRDRDQITVFCRALTKWADGGSRFAAILLALPIDKGYHLPFSKECYSSDT
jgi:hypothetical protein